MGNGAIRAAVAIPSVCSSRRPKAPAIRWNSRNLARQPSIRGAWHPTPDHTLWGAVSRAVRTPTRFDEDLRFGTGAPTVISGSRGFKTEDLIEIDHITPRSMGGGDEPSNLMALHKHCHIKRHQEMAQAGITL